MATGAVNSKTTATKTRLDLLAFMADVVADIPASQEVHVVVDNYCTPKKNEAWLRAHQNVHFPFAPPSASWLHMVEIWLGILTRKALKGASFNSTADLANALADFCDTYHKNAEPFAWRKREVRGAQLRNTIANLLD